MTTTSDYINEFASALVDLSNRLSASGDREEAIEIAKEAVNTYRSLEVSRPDTVPGLAIALSNLSQRLSDVGRREEAMKATREAVEVRRRLAEARPVDFLPDFATAVSNLSNQLSGLGRRDEAVKTIREAIDSYRVLARTRPDTFLPVLASALVNLAAFLSELGRHAEALAPATDAVAIYRQLAAARPEPLLPDLATTLNNQGALLSALNQLEDASRVVSEAIAIYRRLAATRPEAFLADLAKTLDKHGKILAELGSHEEAMNARSEAVDLHSRLALAGPESLSKLSPEQAIYLSDPVHAANQALKSCGDEFERRGIDRHRVGKLLEDAKARIAKYGPPWRSLTDDRLDPEILAARVLQRDPPATEDQELLTETLTSYYCRLLSADGAIRDAKNTLRGKILAEFGVFEKRLEAEPWDPAALGSAFATVLRTPERERSPPERVAALLNAEAELVPLVGREQILQEILDWCDSSRAASVRLFTGPGGSGKTRLFREVCRALPSEWMAGFLDVEHPMPETAWRALAETRPVLAVIDYADIHENKPALQTLLRFAEMLPATAKPIRIALLSRSGGPWWTRFRHKNPSDALETNELPIPFFQSLEHRTAIYIAARAAFAQATGRPEPDIAPDLTESHFERPLFLLMQALLNVLGEIEPSGRNHLLSRILARERHQIAAIIGDRTSAVAAIQLAALVTLAGGAHDQAAAEMMAAACPLSQVLPDAVRKRIIDLLRRHYPRESDRAPPVWLAGVTPDILGEALVAHEVEMDALLLPAFAKFATPAQWATGIHILLCIVRNNRSFVPHLAALLSDHTPKVLAAIAANERGNRPELLGQVFADALAMLDPALAEHLLAHIGDDDAVPLREIALEATRLGLENARTSGQGDDVIAAWLNNLGVRLSALGRREEALVDSYGLAHDPG
ncbi:MAG: tetratricopeptide repeat protein, partial [Alphaproteobacteria bacterium]|nr:tetratricopeptide repeat protein [Alphaproteobacteria bacterium]